MFPGHTLGQTSPSARWRAALGVSSRNRGQIFTVSTKNALAAEPPAYYLDPHQNLFPHGRPGEGSVCSINKTELETSSCALLPLRPNSPWGRSHKLGDGALGTPGAQDQENVIFSLMKVTSSVFFASAPAVCCAPESTWLEKLQSTAFFSVDKTCRQAHA